MGTQFDGITIQMNRRAVNTRGDIRQDQYGNFMVSQGLPPLADLSINRKMYTGSTAAGTAKPPYAAIPTTTATWALYNGGSGNTQLVVLSVHAWLVSGVSGLGEFIFAGVSPTAQTSALTTYASSVTKALAPGSASPVGVFANAATLAGAPAWQPHAVGGGGSADVSDSSGMREDVYGMYIIPPGYAMGLGIYNIGGSAALYGGGFTWAEIEIELP